jgi:hypothetical protein
VGDIPGEILVALAAIKECRPDWLAHPALDSDFPEFLRAHVGELAPDTQGLAYPESIAAYRERFESLAAGVHVT